MSAQPVTEAAKDVTFVLRTSQMRALVTPVLPFAEKDAGYVPILAALRFHTSGGYLYATATDRYRLAVQRVKVQPAEESDEATPLPDGIEFVLERTSIRGLLALHKTVRGGGDPELTFTVSEDRVTVTGSGSFGFMDSSTAWRRLDLDRGSEPYPSLSAVLQAAVDAAVKAPTQAGPTAVNPKYLADFQHASPAHSADPLRMWLTGDMRPILVRLGDDFVGALMPVRWASEEPRTGVELDDAWYSALRIDKPKGTK